MHYQKARKIALNLIKDCVWNSIAVYNHPVEAIIALQPPLTRLNTGLFSKYEGIVDRENINKAYFILDKGKEMREDDQLSSLFGNLNLEYIIIPFQHIPAGKDIIAPGKDKFSVDYITKRIIEQTFKQDSKSLDFKQLFYPANRKVLELPESVPLCELLKYEIGYKKDVKATFMNHISLEVAKAIENRLVELEYQKSSELIQRAFIYLIDKKAQKRFIVSTNITSDGKIIPRKFKFENNKLLFYAFAGPKSTLDFRLKVLSQEPSITNLPIELYNSIINANYNVDTKMITLDDTSNYLFTIRRVKIKRTFIKCKDEFSNSKIKVSISEVYEDEKNDLQVTITSEALHEVIKKMSQTDNIEEKLNIMETIQVPFRSIRHIIGKKYSKINEIERRSKAKCTIKENDVIEVRGANEARKIAINLIKDCVWNSIAVYNHPLEPIIALQPPLARLKTVLFSKYEDIIAPGKDKFSVDYITKRIIEQTIKQGSKSLDFKVRVNIGKQLFYPANREVLELPESIPLHELLKYEIGYKKDVKTTFMNHISLEVAKIIENRLVELEYQKSSEIIQRASIHLIDNQAEKRFIVSTNITSDGKLIPREFKAENDRLLFYSFVGPKSTLDFRFKVLSQQPPITNIPSGLFNTIKNATYNLGTKILTLEDTSNYLFTIARIKIKRIFTKCKDEFSNGKIKVSISEVYEDGIKDVQVTITSEALQKVIEKMKHSNMVDEKLKAATQNPGHVIV
ncbi:10544_t:CDS:2 [Racocetra fulgida]|uniref:10544_t:CDS:1 n=1 Tax=Racocetra fulgida TaxID=60492 RepID=A0A9N8VIB9_9GLOM|nr:10544_t:CDS:2 [Racocetra fulgida]